MPIVNKETYIDLIKQFSDEVEQIGKFVESVTDYNSFSNLADDLVQTRVKYVRLSGDERFPMLYSAPAGMEWKRMLKITGNIRDGLVPVEEGRPAVMDSIRRIISALANLGEGILGGISIFGKALPLVTIAFIIIAVFFVYKYLMKRA